MKKIIVPSLLLLFASISGCKKDKSPSCEISVAGIAANYKITKVEIVSNTGNSDVTNTFLDACRRDAVYQLKNNNVFSYFELGSSCTGTGDGSWNIANNTLTVIGSGGFQFTNAPITSWNCSVMTVTEDIDLAGSAVTGRFTFGKQ